ncbi:MULTISPECIES: hypothetical protein [Streptomyces]|uniref:hypothetical protein n=1 Tax=Streptomyces TaxID=1883 RepID=UPI0007EDBF98|nr:MULTISPECIES: hypothetical protein [unclassified Streptomyces]MCP3768709.1 hypothetical protein [Streptomyces sp. MAR25Y5]OBQ48741.1 hypothetical protein A4U61_27200 [Streptomyces sp. H-KF8]
MTTTPLTRYDHGMLRLMNGRQGRPLYATAVRRRLVVAAHLLLTAAIGGFMTYAYLAEGEPVWSLVVTAVLLLPWMVATGAINAATRGLLELRERALDERQSAERARVQARAHRAMTLLLAATAVVLLTVGAADGNAPTAYVAPVLVAVLVTHWLMPLWVAGLMAQDEPAEDDGPAA